MKRNSNRATRKGFSLPVKLTVLGLIVNLCEVMIYDNFINIDQWFLIRTTQLGIPPSSTFWEKEQSSASWDKSLNCDFPSGDMPSTQHHGLRWMNWKAQKTWDTYCRYDPGKYGLTNLKRLYLLYQVSK